MKVKCRNRRNIKISKKKKLFYTALSIFIAFFLAFVLLEVILRIIPIPGITYDYVKFDKSTGAGLNPHSKVIYRNQGGNRILRKVNSWGYLDKEYKKEKRKGVYRIGFFGDSYVEARQVPLEDTFFRIIERKLENYNVECLAFGISGFSMLQSYLTCERWMNYFDLDLAVYVFSENDLGDQIKEIKRHPLLPYAALTDNGFRIEWYFRKGDRFIRDVYFKTVHYIASRSLVVGTLIQRIGLLLKYGAKVKATEEDMMMATKSKPGWIPDQNDLPSTWPAQWKEHVEKLGSAVLSQWADKMKPEQRKFAVFYVPRAGEMEKDTENQDSWKFWLESFCSKQNTLFIDPTSEFLEIKCSGKDIFSDHFSKEGHLAFANAFSKWFIKNSSNIIQTK
jgi:hypothetical protein